MKTKIEIGPVFNATTHKNFHKNFINCRKCLNPFTFLIQDMDYIDFPSSLPYYDQSKYPTGYPTIREAETARSTLKDHFNWKNLVFLVSKNADFTEGKGQMIPIKIFNSAAKADLWIMKQPGIFDSTQLRSMSLGVNIHGELYCYIYYNGYDIDPFLID